MAVTTISFKSVGTTVAKRTENTLATTVVPIGLKTPLRPGQFGEGVWATHSVLADQIQDNLRNLLLTNWGERLGQYKFGANLREITANFSNQDDFDAEAIFRIKNAITRWMPFVEPDTFSSTVDHNQNEHIGKVRIAITYNVPVLNITNKSLEVTLYVF